MVFLSLKKAFDTRPRHPQGGADAAAAAETRGWKVSEEKHRLVCRSAPEERHEGVKVGDRMTAEMARQGRR